MATQLFCPDCQQPRMFAPGGGFDTFNRCQFCGYRAKMSDYWKAPRLIEEWRKRNRGR